MLRWQTNIIDSQGLTWSPRYIRRSERRPKKFTHMYWTRGYTEISPSQRTRARLLRTSVFLACSLTNQFSPNQLLNRVTYVRITSDSEVNFSNESWSFQTYFRVLYFWAYKTLAMYEHVISDCFLYCSSSGSSSSRKPVEAQTTHLKWEGKNSDQPTSCVGPNLHRQ